MAELAVNQFELDGSLLFGDLTTLQVDNFEIGDADQRDGDTVNPGEGGIQFGRDFRDSRTLTWEIFTDTADAAASRAALAELRAAWDAPLVRLTSRAVVPLRMRQAGTSTVVVYGRPRRLTDAGMRLRPDGVTDHVATFVTSDRLYYSDTEYALHLNLITEGGSGITWPVTWPITWGAGAARQDVARNLGEAATWPVLRIDGPVSQPALAYVGTDAAVRLDTTLAAGEYVEIDTRPWARTCLRGDGASLDGKLRGSRMAELALPVGQTTIRFTGTDLTGQASATVRYRHAHTTP
ncbi:hypothetical protein GCM10023224_05010 [Streptomonospora halophila]|uniref:Phage tail protein n=1 Tax=Streptomonospora halophila TaxID=427369 RepID=A0ABP9G6P7_9ACTN